MRPWVSAIRNAKGMVLPLALLCLVVLSALGLAFLTMSGYEPAVAANHAKTNSALYVAEAGIAHARDVFPTTDINALLQGGGQLFTAQAFGTGNYSVTVANNAADPGGANNDTDGILVLTSKGTFQAAVRQIQVSVKPGTTSPFQGAAFGDVGVTMGGSGGISDSFDSATGSYNAATAHSKGNLASNGDISLNLSTVVKGNATAGGTVINPAGVTGTVTTSAAHVTPPPILDCPAGGYTPASSVPITDSHITYNASTGILKVGGGVNLTLSASTGSTFYFSQVVLSGGSTLTLNTGGTHVDFFISDLLTVGGGGVLNYSNLSTLTPGKPTDLTIKACGNPSKPSAWGLTGGSGAYFAVYAPNHQVVVGGGGDLWGAVIGHEVDNTGGSKFHYDESLARQQWGGNAKFGIVAGTWREF